MRSWRSRDFDLCAIILELVVAGKHQKIASDRSVRARSGMACSKRMVIDVMLAAVLVMRPRGILGEETIVSRHVQSADAGI